MMSISNAMRPLAALAAAVALLTATGPAQGALRVEITQGVSGALPIAIVPFGVEPPLESSVELADVVASDLAGTGLFEPLPRRDMLETPTRADEVDYANWRQVEVDNLVVGSVAPDGSGGYRVSFDILDTYQGKVLTGYQITADDLREAAHAVANLVYEHFTGEKGYFLSRIAYVTVQENAQGEPRYRMVVSDYDGHNPQTVVSSRDPLMSPAWHPAGTRLAYVAFDVDRGRTSLRVHSLHTGEVREISSRPGINGAPAWSPTGTKLAMTLSYRGNPEIYTYDLNTDQLRRLTSNGAIDTEPVWSPDGGRIAFTSDRGGKPQIYRMNTDGSRVERLTFVGESNQRPAYSPDGREMAMVQGGPGGFRIAVLELETNNVRVVSEGPLDESPSFAPNGQTIIFARQEGNAELATVSVDGRVKTRLRQAGEVREPAWSPAGY